MAKKTILSDFENKFFDDFDRFVKFTYTQLCTDVNYGGVSPAYTGYFASSWQVASSGYIKREAPEVSQKRRSKDFPWREVYEDNWRARNAGAPYTRARIAQEEEDARRRNRNRKGRRSTILTTSQGLDEIEDENIKKKSLLGG